MPVTVTANVTVRDEDGFPVSGASVLVFDSTGAAVAAAVVSNADGLATLDAVAPEAIPNGWTFSVSVAGYEPAGGGLVFTAIDECSAEPLLAPDPNPPTLS